MKTAVKLAAYPCLAALFPDLFNGMIAWLRIEVVALMTIIQAGLIRSVQLSRT